MGAFPRDLQETVLVNLTLDAGGTSRARRVLRRSMCSSMCFEFGFRGDWRSQPSKVRTATFFALEQVVQPLAVNVCEPIGQALVDSAICSCNCFRANAFYRI